MTNILVTGGTGQIGKYVCSELAGKGHKVVVFDFMPNPDNVSADTAKIEILKGDVLDLEELLGVIKSKQISHIIHLAALLVLESKQHPSRAVRVNCVGTNNVFEAARLGDIQRVVFTSSVAVYGSKHFFPETIVSEDDFPHCPVDPYSITKLTNELMCEYYRQSYGLDFICLRLAGAWGPGRYTGYTGQFNDFIRRAATGQKAELPQDFAFKDAKLRWLYVKEMGASLAHAALVDRNRVKRALYNVGTSKPFKSLDVIDALKNSMQNTSHIKYKETNEPTQLSSEIAGPSGLDVDCSRFYDELGFVERMNLESAVSDMINFERKKG